MNVCTYFIVLFRMNKLVCLSHILVFIISKRRDSKRKVLSVTFQYFEFYRIDTLVL